MDVENEVKGLVYEDDESQEIFSSISMEKSNKMKNKNKIYINKIYTHNTTWGHCHRAIVLQLPMQSVSITTKVVSLNPAHGELYSIQHYVIKFVSDLWQVSGFLWVLWFPPPIKLTATILLKYC